jgi:SAM-dependent methyltransferase
MYKTNCRVCNHTQLQKVLDLGLSPLANNLLSHGDEVAELFPLELMYCDNCHNCQLSYTVEAGKMFDHYLYVSSTAKSFRDHFDQAANQYINDFNLNVNDLIIDIGSNDGIALKPFKEKGFKVLGIEPAKNIAELANSNGVETWNEYFTQQVADKIKEKASIITASNVFAHADGLEEIAHAAMSILKDTGHFIIEVQYLLDTIKDLTFDNIYHEHVNYWCVTSINNFFNRLGYKVVKVEHVNTHGGSIRVYVNHNGIADSSVNDFLEKENEFGLTDISLYNQFAQNVLNAKLTFLRNIKKIKDQNQTII